MATTPAVGILALQGDVREHAALLTGLGADVVLVRRPDELSAVGGLVIPGGESSVIDKLSRIFGMQQPIRDAIAANDPEGAREAMRQHLTLSQKRFSESFGEETIGEE